MLGKRINVEVIKEYSSLPHFKKGDKCVIQIILRDKPEVLLNAKKPSPGNKYGPFWDELIADAGTMKGYYIIKGDKHYPELPFELSKIFTKTQ